MKYLHIFSGLLLLTVVSFSCSGKVPETEEPATENTEEPTKPEPKPVPTADTEDWVYRTDAKTGEKEKFFGVVMWHVPGYKLTTTPDPDDTNEADYLRRTAYCNVVMVDPRYLKPYMSQRMQMISNFSNTVHGYLDKIDGLPKTATDKDYFRTQYLKANVNNPDFVQALDNAVRSLMNDYRDYERIYAPIDELALGGVARWYIPASVGDKIYERIKLKEKDPIVIVDLMGHGRGSTYFFEQNYLKDHPIMPANPPYELLSENARKQKDLPLLGFSQAHDGTGVYTYDASGKYSYTNLSEEKLKSLWFENVKQVAAAYKNNGNVFSINAFRDFNAYPILAAVTTDALKAGLGKMPVWLYFDGNGYAKPATLSPENYIRSVKCQIYTSLVHGATGIMFWNDWHKTPEVYEALQPTLKELQENLPVIKLQTVDKKIAGHLHLLVKQDANGKQYVVATNTDKSKSVNLPFAVGNKKALAPLEVFVSAL